MNKGNGYTYRSNESSSKELDELKLRYLKQITHHASGVVTRCLMNIRSYTEIVNLKVFLKDSSLLKYI